MENKNIEVSRFTQKAEHYRKALLQVKSSRVLEIYPILSIIEGYIYENGLDKESVKIVDLMAGNGYLSSFLSNDGFKNVYSIEACNEMSFDSEFLNNSNSKLYSIPDIQNISDLLNDIEPQIIVCLASFHHLIKYKPDGSIHKEDSLSLQKKIIRKCLDSLNSNGLLIIADIHDLQSNKKELKKVNYWYPDGLRSNVIPKLNKSDYLKDLIKTNDLNHFNSLVQKLLLKTTDKSLSTKWFREIVDSNTLIGHKDVAIDSQSLSEFSKIQDFCCEIVSCPWIFDSETQLLEFVKLKFGFLVDAGKIKVDIKDELDKNLGIYNIKNGLTSLGWELAVLTFDLSSEQNSKKNLSLKKLSYFIYALLATLIIHFISTRIIVFNLNDKILWAVWGILGGAIFSEISNLLFWSKRKKRRMRIKPSR